MNKETGTAYPEMDKIVQICQKFDINIDDLLNKDIREAKREKQGKNNINKYIDDFLNFISDTVSLFMNMTFKTKIKCILEQIIIFCVLVMIYAIVGNLGRNIIESFNLDYYLPFRIYSFIFGLISGLYYIFAVVLGTVIFVHIFKTRYLNYYNKIKTEAKNTHEEVQDNNIKDEIDSHNKIVYTKNEDKIIIRDPKHSEYRFINGVFKILVCFAKAFVLLMACGICVLLIGFIGCGIFSFTLYTAKLLFLGILLSSISLSIGSIVILLMLLNFIFNRTNDKKKMIWSFILAVILFGVSAGLLFMSSLNFEVMDIDNYGVVHKETMDMEDNLVFQYWDITYVEKNIPNIEIESKTLKNVEFICHTVYMDNKYQFIDFHYRYPKSYEQYKLTLKELSKYRIINYSNSRERVTIYASKDNIEKLKYNYKVAFKE